MDINDLFRLSNNADLESLIPLKSIENPMKYFGVEGSPELFPNYLQLVKIYGYDIADKCFYSKTFMPEIIYFDKDTYVLIELTGALISHMPKNELIKNITQFAEEIKDYGLENEMVSWKLSSKFKMSLLDYYMKNQDDINYSQFIDFYLHSDYGFDKLTNEKIRSIFDTPHERIGQSFIDKLPDTVVVYRGEGDKSTSLNKALSWTLNLQIAYFFAVKNSQATSFVYTASVQKKDILEYIDARDEKELLIYPENIHLINKDIIYSFNDIKVKYKKEYNNTQFVACKLINLYNELLIANKFVIDSHEHGLSHMYRVCFLSGLIHETLRDSSKQLNDSTLVTVMTAGLLHDVGRINELDDIEHGKRGSEMYADYTSHYHPIVKSLIEYHDRDDREFEKHLEQKSIQNRDMIIKCFHILKDADALDRVRFGIRNLNIDYLREDISCQFILTARELLHAQFNIEDN